jgi:hypothetical protein
MFLDLFYEIVRRSVHHLDVILVLSMMWILPVEVFLY